jgi:hypothetical protein
MMWSQQSQWMRLFEQQRDALDDLGLAATPELNGEDDFVSAVEAAFEAHVQGSGFQASIRLTQELGRTNSLVAAICSIARVSPSSTLIWDTGLALLNVRRDLQTRFLILSFLTAATDWPSRR